MSELLPTVDPSSLPAHFDSEAARERLTAFWEKTGVYRWDASRPREETFVVDTPPPTVSGSLHVGHVFSYTHADIIVRHRRMKGMSIYYPMGWDDNGLPTERRVQNYFHVRCDPSLPYDPALKTTHQDKPQGAPMKVSRRNFIELCRIVTEADEKAFRDLWQAAGLSVDWREMYATIGDSSRRAAQESFLELHARGHAYNREEPVMWDVDFHTAVAQAEVEDRPVSSAFHKIEFAVEGSGAFVVATTRPELLPACVAVAAHPEDPRYRGLIGRRAITPLFRVPVPIFSSDVVDREKGTGILMVCTFGDSTDLQWWRERKLPLRQIIGMDGRLLPMDFGAGGAGSLNAAAAEAGYARLVGKNVVEARKEIVAMLRDPAAAAGAAGPAASAPLKGEPEPLTHTVNFYEKGDRPLELVTTRQWFVRLLDKKEMLIRQGNAITWHPDHMRLRYLNWTENLQFDWCVSRQRYFGVAFPVWYPLDAEAKPDYGRPILAESSRLPVDPMSEAPTGFTESRRGAPGGFIGEADVFDTWFTSSLTPQILSGWKIDEERHRKLFPMDLRPQAHDIIRTWAFYTIAKSALHEGSLPWSHIALSGWILDPDRKKMSKSRGNVVTPMEYLERYTPDGVRYWAGMARLGTDTAFDEKMLSIGKRLVTKIYNAGKFVLSQTARRGLVTEEIDRAFCGELAACAERSGKALDEMEFARALMETESFFWGSFTDSYIELVKTRAKSGAEADPGRVSAVAGLRLGLSVLLRLFAPYLPFVTEEVWRWVFAAEMGQPSIHKAPWPGAVDFSAVPAPGNALSFHAASACLQAIHRHKTQSGASVGIPLSRVVVKANTATIAVLERGIKDVMAAARAESWELKEAAEMQDMEMGVMGAEPMTER